MLILVVDDQENMCWILSKVLENAGFTVETAGTVAKALAIAAHQPPDAVIIDYRLPDQNGFELFVELRKHQPTLPGVLITSYGSKKLREAALRLGFVAYFDKPFDNQALIAALQSTLPDLSGKHTRKSGK